MVEYWYLVESQGALTYLAFTHFHFLVNLMGQAVGRVLEFLKFPSRVQAQSLVKSPSQDYLISLLHQVWFCFLPVSSIFCSFTHTHIHTRAHTQTHTHISEVSTWCILSVAVMTPCPRLLDSAGYCCKDIQSIQYVHKMLYPKVNIHACVQTRPWQESSKPCAKNYFSMMVGRG